MSAEPDVAGLEAAERKVILQAQRMWDALTFGNIHRIASATAELGAALNDMIALRRALNRDRPPASPDHA